MTQHAPWFVHESIAYLQSKLQPGWLCFEWGSGWSTLWLAELTGFVFSIEHDRTWYDQTGGWLKDYGLAEKAKLILHLLKDGNHYADAILDYPDNHFDLIEIDGRQRARCTVNAVGKLKPGGILVIDNSGREQYQASIEAVGIRRWEHVDFYSGNSEGWTTSIYFKPKG